MAAGVTTDPRLGDLVSANRLGDETRVVLMGFPSDEGVRRNGGRPGAAGGPPAIREALYRMTPAARDARAFTRLIQATVDLGDVPVTGDLETDQQALADALAPLLARGIVPIVLGGGHETAYGHFLAHVATGREITILNWDAHADVRPLLDGRGHSGSPFRQALDHASGLCRSYSVAGLFPWRVAAEHAAFIRERGGSIAWRDELTETGVVARATECPGPAMASFDLDLVDAAAAPGVSAPGVGGLEPRLWLSAAGACGRNAAFLSFDVVEMNPLVDESGRTAVLAALTVWQILEGLATR